MQPTRCIVQVAVVGIGLAFLPAQALPQDEVTAPDSDFQVKSTTFVNDGVLPISTIHNFIQDGRNICSVGGSPGGNQSPELSWTGTPSGTKSFVVVAYDVTAGFTHWGMYNIPAHATGLPKNAGVAGSSYGTQVLNDYFIGAEYDGPCPPPNVAPFAHHYVFTVYALSTELSVAGSANFPAGPEALYHALIRAAREYKSLASSSITGLYSTTPR
jgi:Raf kinase inhibitor-like YbhB/YbcL family protein